jgi:hypothetical protein
MTKEERDRLRALCDEMWNGKRGIDRDFALCDLESAGPASIPALLSALDSADEAIAERDRLLKEALFFIGYDATLDDVDDRRRVNALIHGIDAVLAKGET